MDSILEGPEVEFVHCLVVHVGRAALCLALSDRVAIRFLFLRAAMLGCVRAAKRHMPYELTLATKCLTLAMTLSWSPRMD